MTLHPLGVVARYIVLGAGLGVMVGLLWVWLAPRVLLNSSDATDFVDAYPQGFAQADLTLGALLLGAGCVIGFAGARRLRRTHFNGGWVHVVGVVSAAAMCAAVARVVGWWLAGRAPSELPGGRYELPLTVGASGVFLLAGFSALLVVVFYAAFAREAVTPAVVQSEPASQ